jgi:DNA repair exonuclease SbcCD ATPase subunit
MTASSDQHDDELGPPAFEDLSDEARERDLAQRHRAAIETAITQLRAGDTETARRTLAAQLEEAERCPICGVRDGEACDTAAHERAHAEGQTRSS